MRYNQRLTREDAEQIRALCAWKTEQIQKLNDTASVRALAEKLDAPPRCIERVLAQETHKEIAP